MIGSLFYCLALLAATEMELPENSVLDVGIEIAAHIAIPNTSECSLTTQDVATSLDTEQKAAPVTLTHAITPDMLRYKHWTGTYSPELFDLFINDTKVSLGETYTLTDPKQPFIVTFNYSFMNGMRKGTKAFSYNMNENSSNATLTFSWLDPWKVLIDNASPVKEIT